MTVNLNRVLTQTEIHNICVFSDAIIMYDGNHPVYHYGEAIYQTACHCILP